MGFPLIVSVGTTLNGGWAIAVNAPAVVLKADKPPPGAPAAGLAPSLERRRLRFYLAQMAIDVGLLIGCGALAGYLYFRGAPTGHPLLAAQLLLPLFLTIALHNGTYSLGTLTDWRTSSVRMVTALLISAALLNFVAFFAQFNAVFSRVVFVGGLTSATVAMIASRILLARWIVHRWGPSPINRLVIDAGGPPITIPHAYRIDAAEHGLTPALDDPHALDRLSRYLRNMDEVIVTCPMEQRPAWAKVLKGSGVHGEVTSELAREIGALGVIHRENGDSSLLVSIGPLGIRARASKRMFDIAVSGGALLVLSPVLLAAALAIKLGDGGPVFFRQRRLGRSNQFFSIYKLRTMRFEAGDADGLRSAGREDDRVTRVGRFLRSTSIDELPQLFNVLRGEMSIVGPRPHALGSHAGDKLFWQVDNRYWQRHSLRPGLTGLAQIRGFRGATDHEDDLSARLQADLEYLAGWTIWRDIAIVFRTFPVIMHDRAY
jgi:lipopolysaccharide/colanic/teichoic acid biosynthesis glycosyltransferase